jgi:drug/metabolite transporter (DMT)-like permease
LKGKIMIKWLFRVSISLGLAGMAFGIVMGIRHDFSLAPAHAHLNLLGFVAMFLSALYYRAVPEAAASRLAAVQAVVSVVGAIVFPVGIACVVLGGHERFEPVVVAGALTVFLGMVLFAVIVYRTSGSGAAQAGTVRRN